jgi:transcriptional regulator with XRE-family HTH domain
MTEAPARSFGALLRAYRLSARMSQEELAERARLSAKTIGALERGERQSPYRDTIGLLAAALGLGSAHRRELEAAARRRGVRAAPSDSATGSVNERIETPGGAA